MKYKIVLSEPSRGERYTLEYAVDEHPAARKWALLTRKAAFWGLGKGRPAAVARHLAATEADLQALISGINLLLRAVRDEGLVRIEESDLTMSNLDQERLNRIHAIFQCHEETRGFEAFASASTVKLRELNVLVHQCEMALSNRTRKSRQQSLVVTLKYSRSLPLDEADYDRLSVNQRFGDLYMGYATVGKSLPHCFRDDDTALVRARGVRPKVAASAEVLAVFPSAASPPDFEARYLERYDAWCERNRVRDFGYDFKAKRHRPGVIRVGRLLNDLNFEMSVEVLRTYSVVSHTLLET